jgi:UDP-N-acetylmuramoyl-tripeptide--D-alanyl-D-alanine ligase
MMELGEESVHEHELLVQLIKQHHFDNVILVGGNFKTTHQQFIYFNTAGEACDYIKHQQFKNSFILIKGSRSMQMEKVLAAFAQ